MVKTPTHQLYIDYKVTLAACSWISHGGKITHVECLIAVLGLYNAFYTGILYYTTLCPK